MAIRFLVDSFDGIHDGFQVDSKDTYLGCSFVVVTLEFYCSS